ncbi:hypothetical protein D8674_012631 [Pyrus ussuriensis x Pyrus communis]|uniref:Uncharacterized protein n=1 Tax=Pyrus ussuriensis x Pyrus communis TaxID=2448454 RepID=A0A5N5G264_9ROSA|nr:hypothetical protein D8674_012631 [Pyrus ussuriensis x Pyrus communis]
MLPKLKAWSVTCGSTVQAAPGHPVLYQLKAARYVTVSSSKGGPVGGLITTVHISRG